MNSDINFSHGPIVIMESCNSQPYHMHKNAQELIWLLEGEAGVTFNNKEYFLNGEDDLMLIVVLLYRPALLSEIYQRYS